MWIPSFPRCFSLFTWRSPTNRLVHPLIHKVRLLLLGGWNREWDWRLRRRMRDSETCCVQRGGVVSFQPDMGEQIRAPLRSIASARASVFPRLPCALFMRMYELWPSINFSRSALQCSRAPITVGLVPFLPLYWKWCGLPYRVDTTATPTDLQRSCQRPRAPPPQSWRNDNHDIRPLRRQEIVQLPCPLFEALLSLFFLLLRLIQYSVG